MDGDELIAALIPVADRLVTAVHADDAVAVGQLLEEPGRLADDPLIGAWHLAVVLAGMCSEDHNPDAALGWTLDPAAYQANRSTADALTASLRAGRTAPTGGTEA